MKITGFLLNCFVFVALLGISEKVNAQAENLLLKHTGSNYLLLYEPGEAKFYKVTFDSLPPVPDNLAFVSYENTRLQVRAKANDKLIDFYPGGNVISVGFYSGKYYTDNLLALNNGAVSFIKNPAEIEEIQAISCTCVPEEKIASRQCTVSEQAMYYCGISISNDSENTTLKNQCEVNCKVGYVSCCSLNDEE